MLHDLCLTAEALKAAAEWAHDGPDAADVELLVDDRMLLVEQGDDRAAFDTGGEPGSEDYLAVAPLDRPTHTPAGYDPTWLAAINRALRDRGSNVKVVDLDDEVWTRFIGPMLDAMEG